MIKVPLTQTDWDAVERDYRDPSVPFALIRRRYGLTNREFYAYADLHGWPRRRKHERRSPRPLRALERSAQALLEDLNRKLDDEEGCDLESAVSQLDKIVRMYQRIDAMEAAAREARKAAAPPPKDFDREEMDIEDRRIIEHYLGRQIEYGVRRRLAEMGLDDFDEEEDEDHGDDEGEDAGEGAGDSEDTEGTGGPDGAR
jgi:hypothetical protein